LARLSLKEAAWLEERADTNCFGAFGCALLLAAGIDFQACSLEDDEPDGQAHGCSMSQGSASRFKELDRIPVRILDLDLSTTGAGFHLVAKVNAGLL
jgi:hypothetical protein